MKKFVLLFFVCCFLFGLDAQTYPKAPGVIRLLTYNTHYCKGGGDPGSIDDYNTRRVALVIEALDADVVALQELDSAMNGRNRRNLLQQITDYTGKPYTPIFGGLCKLDGGKVGPGVLINPNLPISKVKLISLGGSIEERCAMRIDFDQFVFFCTHLDLDDNLRIMSANTLINELDYIRKPSFLAGDLNDSHLWGQGGIAFPTLLTKYTIASDTEGNTIPGRTDTNGLIDYILYHDYKDSGIKIVDTHIVRELKVEGSVIDLASVSDHYPVFVDIEVPGLSAIENATATQEVKLYPTFVQDRLNIESEAPVEQVNVYSLTGQTQLQLKGSDIRTVDLSALNKGIYIVETSAQGISHKARIIKQ